MPVRAAFGALSVIHLILNFSLFRVFAVYVIFFDDLGSTEDTLIVSGLFLGPELLLISGLFTFGKVSHKISLSRALGITISPLFRLRILDWEDD